MAFRSARENADDADSGDASASAHSHTSDTSGGGGAGAPTTPAECVDQLGMRPPNQDTFVALRRMSKRYGVDNVSQWVDEGMALGTMGDPAEMEAFRERQAERPPEVPTDVERQNEQSLHRSRKAHHDIGAAGDTGVPDSVRDVVTSPGTDLPGDVKSGLEESLGTSLDQVQVHTGPRAQQACEQVNARAFTVGNHIAFGPGEFDPSSSEGQHLIAHEVVHTLQQPDAAMSMMPKADLDLAVDPDPQAEREAEEIAGQVMQGGDVGMESAWQTEVHVQRLSDDLSSHLPEMNEKQQAVIEEGGSGTLLDIDPEKLKRLQEAVDDLEQTAGEISELSAEIGVTVDPARGETTMIEETPTPIEDGLAVTVSHEHDLSELGLSQDQQELVRKQKQLLDQFETTCTRLIDELQDEPLPEESTFRDFLTDAGVSSGVAGVMYKAIQTHTEYYTLASMLQSEVDVVGPQGAGLIDNIAVAFGALLTSIALSYGKNKLSSDGETGEGDDPYTGGEE